MDQHAIDELQQVVDELSGLVAEARTCPDEAAWDDELAELALIQRAGDRLVEVLRRRAVQLAARQ